jgi:hypothetical protein
MTSSEQQRILPPWLQGAINARDGDDHSLDYGSSSVASDEYDSSEDVSLLFFFFFLIVFVYAYSLKCMNISGIRFHNNKH